MSRGDELRARQEAELAVVELEEELVALKDGGDPEALRECKLALREARQAHRQLREGDPAGDGEARPATVQAAAAVRGPGGGS